MTDILIAGVGMTNFGRHMDKSYKDLTAEAVQMALGDAGADKNEVGEAFFASCVIGFLQDAIQLPEGTCKSTAAEDTPGATKDQIKGWNAWCDLSGSSLHP